MGVFRSANVVEQRIYDDPNNPATSPYDVALPMTVPQAVIDPNTGKTLNEMLAETVNDTPATEFQAGLMTPAQVMKLAGISYGANLFIHPTNHPAIMITTDPMNRFVTDEWLQYMADFVEGADGTSIGDLRDQIAYIMFQLAMHGIIGGGDFDNIVVDTFNSPDAVNLIAGMFGGNRIFI